LIPRVWAPAAARIEVQCSGQRIAMAREERGWWRADSPAPAGADYAFIIDDGAPLPDPRSNWQPSGVHGFSRIVDHAAFPWTDAGWNAPPLSSAVIYELHTGTFTSEGTFDAAIGRLDYLRALGVTHVELMPVAQFDRTHGWGYDGVDPYAPHDSYGGPDGLKRLVDACHARGLAVLLDVVYNHFGPSGNYLARFGPYQTRRYATPWGEAINFDGAGSDEVRRYFCDNALMWLRDYHADGLRIDAVHAIIDTSALHFLEQLAREVDLLEARLGRRLALIAESDLNDPRIARAPEIGGYGIDALWCDDWHHAIHALLTGERSGYYADFGALGDLAKSIRQGYVYDGRYSAYRDRTHGRPPEGLGGAKFVCFLQNHDQVGNRARGERLCHLVSRARLKIAAALLMTAPFVPLIFQGEEWAATAPFQYFTSFADAKLGRAVTAGRRREFAAFGWNPEEIPDPQSSATFERSKLDWREIDREPHASMVAWYRNLVALRRKLPPLADRGDDELEVRFDERQRWLSFERAGLSVACNLGGEKLRVPIGRRDARRVLLCSGDETQLGEGFVELAPESVAIVGPPHLLADVAAPPRR
jgi:maltooligosyltrehalose trehalohydrolase